MKERHTAARAGLNRSRWAARRGSARFRYTATAIVALLALAGCRGEQKTAATAAGLVPAEPRGTGHLDPPELATHPVGAQAGGVPVFCYHYFRPQFAPGYLLRVLGSVVFGMPSLGTREFWTTPVGEFERLLRYVKEHDIDVLSLDDVADLVAEGAPLPPRAIVLTIDDADQSVYKHAFPLLKKYGVRAHLFVPTSHVGQSWSGIKVCDWDQLREMAASGLVAIDSHLHNLHFKMPGSDGMEPVFLRPDLIPEPTRAGTLSVLERHARDSSFAVAHTPALDDALSGPWGPVAADLLASRLEIARAIGTEPRWLAWPYGFASPALEGLSRTIGFRGSVSLAPRAFAATNTRLHVGRYTVTAQSTLAEIIAAMPPH